MKKIIKTSLAALLVIASLTACSDTKDNSNFNEAGTYETEETLETATITSDGVILSNKVIEGDLNINLNEGNTVTLQNVTVNGSINIVNEAISMADVFFVNTKAASDYLTVNMFDSTSNEINVKKVSAYIVASGTTNVNVVNTDSDLRLVEQNISKNGFNDVTVGGNKDVKVTLMGAGIRSLDVDGSGVTTVTTDASTLIEMLTANSEVNVEGAGKINVLVANAVVTATEAAIGNTVIGDNGAVNGEGEKEEATTTTTTAVTTKATTKTTTTKKVTTTKKPVTSKVTTTTTTPKPVVTTTTTTTRRNSSPIISADDVKVMYGESFNPLKGVTIYDAEDGNITVTSKHIKSNTVNTSRTGTYYVTYSYTDKGGLTTTYERKVVVTRTVDEPKNVSAELNKFGELVVSWDPVDNLDWYEVYVGNTKGDPIVVSKRKTSVTISLTPYENGEDFTDEEDPIYYIDRSTTIYVCAAIDEEDEDEEWYSSSFAKTTYTPLKEIDTFPSKVYEGDNKSFALRIPAEGLPEELEASVRVQIEDEDENYVGTLKNTHIGVGKTNSSGLVEFDYNRDTGMEFEVDFEEPGYYYFDIHITDGEGFNYREEYVVEVREKSGGSSSSSTAGRGSVKPEITDYEVGARFAQGATVYFTLTNDLDLSDKDANIEIIVDWYTDEFEDEIVTKATSYTCPYTGEKIYSDETDKVEDEGNGYFVYHCVYPEEEGTITYPTKFITTEKYIEAGEELEFTFNLTQSKVTEIYELLSADYEVTFTITIEVTDEDGDVREVTTKKKSYHFD